MKEDAFWVFAFDDGTDAETKNKKREHRSPGVKEHSKDQDDKERNEHVRDLPEIKDHDWRIDHLAHDGGVLCLEEFLLTQLEFLPEAVKGTRKFRLLRQCRKCF